MTLAVERLIRFVYQNDLKILNHVMILKLLQKLRFLGQLKIYTNKNYVSTTLSLQGTLNTSSLKIMNLVNIL
ncbi:Uncharacterised protein [Mycobacterium tuberculosis]|nr:Uncharacterised protein [Mycobacterium tuberculosis]